jgi:hypothetical protein
MQNKSAENVTYKELRKRFRQFYGIMRMVNVCHMYNNLLYELYLFVLKIRTQHCRDKIGSQGFGINLILKHI